ncbi:MAG: zinc-dependent alcohol dehydrogenase family protein [Phycisphaeraceae bacterium]|nr:zinc-dependent alcohol dehydrogenase family protein [Phycisphaeraceae bacterium]
MTSLSSPKCIPEAADMKAMVLESTGSIDDADRLVLQDRPEPAPSEDELKIRVTACGVCRTDLHIIEDDLTPPSLPLTPGHQIVGEVVETGDGCDRFTVGDRVGVAWLRSVDGTCRFCRRGRENLCPESRYTGYHADGGYAEYTTVTEDFAYALPDAFDDDAVATPLLCAGLIGYRALERTDIVDGGTLLMVGFGSSAHMIAPIARHRGLRLLVVTRSESHQQLARNLGAAWAGDDFERLPQKADAAIHFAPVGDLVPPIMASLDRAGVLAIAGIHLTDIPPLDYQDHLFQEREIRTVTANTREDARNLLIEAAKADVQPHITRYPLEQANEALRDMKASRIDGTAVLDLSSGT